MNLKTTRRQFLKLLAASASLAAFPAFSKTREPYVLAGDVVNYVGLQGGFISGQIVQDIDVWDGVGFPVMLFTNTYPSQIEVYYDFDLACFGREIPINFWHSPSNCKRYNNVHTYLREKRFT